MIKKKLKKAVIKSYIKSKDMEKPILRLCADIRTQYPFSINLYKEIEKEAVHVYSDACFLIGRYEDELSSYAEKHFSKEKFPYSLMDVDGIKKNGDINISLWMIKEDIEKTKPDNFRKTFYDISLIDLGKRVKNLEELPKNMKDIQGIRDLCITTTQYKLSKLPLMKIVYNYGGMENPLKLPGPYIRLPPQTWGFYNEEEAPRELIDFEKSIRKGIRNILK
tara:strand:- start:21077 stop:21739 length:663 start_codon:yes stop_codon:yes gene_type:complete